MFLLFHKHKYIVIIIKDLYNYIPNHNLFNRHCGNGRTIKVRLNRILKLNIFNYDGPKWFKNQISYWFDYWFDDIIAEIWYNLYVFKKKLPGSKDKQSPFLMPIAKTTNKYISFIVSDTINCIHKFKFDEP